MVVVCLALIQDVTLVVMCAWFLHRVSPWLFCVYGFLYRVSPWLSCVHGFNTGCHLACYVCLAFVQGVTLVVMCVWSLYRV